MSQRRLFTSESVSEGHPDKVCDQISDAVLDALLEQDPMSRVACETLATTGVVFIAGEITTEGYADLQEIARSTLNKIGYNDPAKGIDCNSCAVINCLDKQSPDIARGVNSTPDHEQGAGDQGMMFGYACRETPELMPLPIQLAHRLVERLAELRRDGTLPYLRPDAKSQVTVEYEGSKLVGIRTVVISTQHDESICQNGGKGEVKEEAKEELIEKVIRPVLPTEYVDDDLICHINPTGRFVIGGPQGDCGLTGRKIICDTYGGASRHGGGAFSGKDPSKVDRSAAYAARWVAKNIVAAGLADRCELQVAYAIGVAHPVSVAVDSFGTGKIDDLRITELVMELFDLRPGAIIERLQLRRPIFTQTATYGHFGRELEDFTWEKTDMAEALKSKV